MLDTLRCSSVASVVYYGNAETLVEEALQAFCAFLFNNVNNFGQRYGNIFNDHSGKELALVNALNQIFTENLYLFAINKGDIAIECESTLVTNNGTYIAYNYIIQPKHILICRNSLDQFLKTSISIED